MVYTKRRRVDNYDTLSYGYKKGSIFVVDLGVE